MYYLVSKVVAGKPEPAVVCENPQQIVDFIQINEDPCADFPIIYSIVGAKHA